MGDDSFDDVSSDYEDRINEAYTLSAESEFVDSYGIRHRVHPRYNVEVTEAGTTDRKIYVFESGPHLYIRKRFIPLSKIVGECFIENPDPKKYKWIKSKAGVMNTKVNKLEWSKKKPKIKKTAK